MHQARPRSSNLLKNNNSTAGAFCGLSFYPLWWSFSPGCEAGHLAMGRMAAELGRCPAGSASNKGQQGRDANLRFPSMQWRMRSDSLPPRNPGKMRWQLVPPGTGTKQKRTRVNRSRSEPVTCISFLRRTADPRRFAKCSQRCWHIMPSCKLENPSGHWLLVRQWTARAHMEGRKIPLSKGVRAKSQN